MALHATVTIDNISNFLLALTAFLAAVAAILHSINSTGKVAAVADKFDAVSKTVSDLRSDLTNVALNTPAVPVPAITAWSTDPGAAASPQVTTVTTTTTGTDDAAATGGAS